MFAPVLVAVAIACPIFHGPAIAGDFQKTVLPASSQVVATVCPMPYIVSNTISTPEEIQK